MSFLKRRAERVVLSWPAALMKTAVPGVRLPKMPLIKQALVPEKKLPMRITPDSSPGKTPVFLIVLAFSDFPLENSFPREARLRDLDLDDSRKRGHVDVHLEFLHFSNRPPPIAAFPALREVEETIERRRFAAFR